MKNFQQIHDLPIYENLLDFIEPAVMSALDVSGQVCINTVSGHENNFMLGAGSLFKNTNSTIDTYDMHSKERFHERDFTVVCDQFKDTVFEEIFEMLSKNYLLGRLKIFKSRPMTCLSWHTDFIPRIHYPIKTQEGCFMVIDDEIKHLEQDKWYMTNTEKYHTAFNASRENRIHLVGVIRK